MQQFDQMMDMWRNLRDSELEAVDASVYKLNLSERVLGEVAELARAQLRGLDISPMEPLHAINLARAYTYARWAINGDGDLESVTDIKPGMSVHDAFDLMVQRTRAICSNLEYSYGDLDEVAKCIVRSALSRRIAHKNIYWGLRFASAKCMDELLGQFKPAP